MNNRSAAEAVLPQSVVAFVDFCFPYRPRKRYRQSSKPVIKLSTSLLTDSDHECANRLRLFPPSFAAKRRSIKFDQAGDRSLAMCKGAGNGRLAVQVLPVHEEFVLTKRCELA